MIMRFIQGFCMALADSVPGVSGGTVAFLMGFYDDFIGSLDALFTGKKENKKKAVIFLLKIGIGWVVGFAIAAIALASIFTTHIYDISSVFIGFIIFAIPLVIFAERQCFKLSASNIISLIIGIVVVVGITYFSNSFGNAGVNIDKLSLPIAIYVFVAGMIAICAMVLPGISGSSLLLIFGLYMPIMSRIKGLLTLDFSGLPIIIIFGLGIVAGILCTIKLVKRSLQNYRSQTLNLVVGLMLGSIYAIIYGPASLDIPQAPMTLDTFSILWFLIGGAVIIGMQFLQTKKADKF